MQFANSVKGKNRKNGILDPVVLLTFVQGALAFQYLSQAGSSANVEKRPKKIRTKKILFLPLTGRAFLGDN